MFCLFNSRKYTQSRNPTVVQGGWGGGGLMESLPWVSDMVQFKRFYLQWKAFDFLEKMRRILWILTRLKACDVI